jgi:hypothetical protein
MKRPSWRGFAGWTFIVLLFLWAEAETWRYYANLLKDRNAFDVGNCEVIVGPEWLDFPRSKGGDPMLLVKWRPFLGSEEGRHIVLFSLTNPAAFAQFESDAKRLQFGNFDAFLWEQGAPKGAKLFVPACNALLVSPKQESFEGIQFAPHDKQ